MNRPVGLLKKAAESASPRGIRKISENGRMIYSNYFPRNGDFLTDAKRRRVRAYSKITILGDQRPYTVVFEVIIERREGRRYTKVDSNSKLAREIKESFRDFIDKRPNGRDLIDDFRAF